MRRAVGADQSGAVDREAHRQPLDGDVVHDLVVGALQEGRVDRRERLQPFGRQPGRERDAVLLGDADVERALGEFLAEQIEPGARRHGGRDGDDLVVLAGLLDQALGEDLGVGRRGRLRLRLRAGDDVELDDAVILVVGRLGGRIALALLGDDVDQDRTVLGVAHVPQHRQQVIEVVAVDRADIVEAELVEQRAALTRPRAYSSIAHRALLEERRQVLGDLAHEVAQRAIGAAGDAAGEIGRQRADRRRDRHVVVVEDDDQPRVHRAGVVHRLVRHAGRHGAVADHRDHVVVAAAEVARHRHAEAGRDRGRGMRGAERVVFALGALGEAGEAAAGAKRADAVAPPGEDLVRIGLVADVPDQTVARRVEHVVQRHRELDDAEPGAEVAAGHRYRVDRLLPQLVRHLPQLGLFEAAQVGWKFDLVEQRGLGGLRQMKAPHAKGAAVIGLA